MAASNRVYRAHWPRQVELLEHSQQTRLRNQGEDHLPDAGDSRRKGVVIGGEWRRGHGGHRAGPRFDWSLYLLHLPLTAECQVQDPKKVGFRVCGGTAGHMRPYLFHLPSGRRCQVTALPRSRFRLTTCSPRAESA